MKILIAAARLTCRLRVLSFGALIMAPLSAVSQDAVAPAGPDQASVRTVVVTVAGNSAWTDTGIDVSAGDRVSFEAEGMISLQKGNPEAECGPDGYDLQTLQQPLTGKNLGALIGKVVIGVTVLVNEKTKEERREEAAELFYVGTKSRVEMPVKGRLFLGINENVIGDNEGEFRVTVMTPVARPSGGAR